MTFAEAKTSLEPELWKMKLPMKKARFIFSSLFFISVALFRQLGLKNRILEVNISLENQFHCFFNELVIKTHAKMFRRSS